MKVTLLLKNDHEALRGLIDKFRKTSMGKHDRKALFQEIQSEVQIHSRMTSDIFYSALAASPSDRAVQLVASAQEKCDAVEKLFQEMNRMNPADHNFDVKMNTLIAEIGNHIEMEEDELFHEARKTFPEYRLEELGLEMDGRRTTLKKLALA